VRLELSQELPRDIPDASQSGLAAESLQDHVNIFGFGRQEALAVPEPNQS